MCISGNYRDSICETRLKALECFEKLSVTNPLEADVTSVTSTGTTDVKLPKLSLPKFSGDVLQWQSFWDQFTAVVDSSDIPDISKFSYLRSLLEGEAKQSIQGLSLTSQHYQSARQILTDRFCRKERIIFTHIQTLLNMPVMNKCLVSNLWKLNDDLQSHTRSLEALGICGTQYGVILTPLILSRLPQDVRLEWSREGEGHESDLSYLLEFLEKEIMRRERSQVFKDTVQVSLSVPEARRLKASPTAAALQTASMNVKPSAPHECGVCGMNHPTDRCFKLIHLMCLNAGRECRGQAYVIGACARDILPKAVHLCAQNVMVDITSCYVGSNPFQRGLLPMWRVSINMCQWRARKFPELLSRCQVWNHRPVTRLKLLVKWFLSVRTARVKVRGARGVTEATILFYTGSDRSYVTSELVGKVGPSWVDSQPIAYSGFGAGNTSKAQMRSIFDLILQDEHGSDQSLFATEVSVICAPLVCPEVPQSVLTLFGELSMAWDYTLSSESKLDILVGLDSYWKFVKPQITGCSVEGLMAQSTVFGWVLFGSVLVSQMTAPVMSHPMLCLTASEQSVKSFWELESIGISPDKEDSVLTRFENDLRQVEGRYEVTLPWKSAARERLLDNEKLARYRLDSLRRRLERDPPLKLRYDAAIQEMCDTSIVEEVPVDEMACENPVFYMPHHPVVRESAVSTKVRPVFDASAKGYNGISLNDCMEIGPCLLTNLTQILIRFRRLKFPLTADIQKAFLQISVHRDDCDVHRCLWDCDGQVKVMRFRRVPFGNCSSPFLLNATVQHHLSLFPASRTVTELQQNLYVDDFLSGCDFVEETCQMIHEACDVMSQGCMTLTKWSSNSTEVADVLQREFKGKHLDDDSIKVLGLYWLASSDCFMFHAAVPPEGLCLTKRVVLSWFFTFIWSPQPGSTLHYAGKMSFPGAVEIGFAVGWWNSSRISDTVYEVGWWIGSIRSVENSEELHGDLVVWHQVLAAPWVWRCIPQGIWGMCLFESWVDRWFLYFILSYRQVQGGTFEADDFTSTWAAWGPPMCSFGEVCEGGLDAVRWGPGQVLDGFYDRFILDPQWSCQVENFCVQPGEWNTNSGLCRQVVSLPRFRESRRLVEKRGLCWGACQFKTLVGGSSISVARPRCFWGLWWAWWPWPCFDIWISW